MGIKRCPSFSKRPGFPCGLRVLLVDADDSARSSAETLLKECSYTVSTCLLILACVMLLVNCEPGCMLFALWHSDTIQVALRCLS